MEQYYKKETIDNEIEEKIIQILKKENKALSVFELEDILKTDKKQLTQLMKILNKLEQELKI